MWPFEGVTYHLSSTVDFKQKPKENKETKLCQHVDMLRTLNNILILIKIQEQTLEMFSELISNTKISFRVKWKFHSFFLEEMSSLTVAHRHPNELKILWLPWWAFSTCSSWKRWAPVAPIMVSCLAWPVSCVSVGLAFISEGVDDTFNGRWYL